MKRRFAFLWDDCPVLPFYILLIWAFLGVLLTACLMSTWDGTRGYDFWPAIVLPARFAETELEELATNDEFVRRGIEGGPFSILRDRRNGQTKPLLLRDLRLRVEAGEKFPRDEWGGCGCGGASK